MHLRRMSDNQFQALYDFNLPKLYRAALVMTGNLIMAEQAAGAAFLETIVKPDCARDARAFTTCSLRRLCQLCADDTEIYDEALVVSVGLSERQADMLSRYTPGERALIVLAAVLGLSATEVAGVVRMPPWFVSWRLKYLARGMQAEEKFFEEEATFYLSEPLRPF